MVCPSIFAEKRKSDNQRDSSDAQHDFKCGNSAGRSIIQKGHVNRKTNSDDKRALSISLSGKNKKHMEAFRKRRIEETKHIFDVLTDEEFESCCHLLKKITENMGVKEK